MVLTAYFSLRRMYSLDDLFHLLHSDGAERLRLDVGQPPVMVIDGQDEPIDGPAITTEDAEQLLQSVTDTRQRRELRQRGDLEFVYTFRQRASFVVHARIRNETVSIEIH